MAINKYKHNYEQPLESDNINVSGNIVTGNLIGNVTGNVNATGVSTFSDIRVAGGTISGISTAGITTAYIGSVNGGSLSGARNRIINGDMRIDQRNVGASVIPTTLTYTVDRWGAVEQTDGSIFVQQSGIVPVGFTSSLSVTVSSTDSALGSLQYAVVRQSIEGANISDLNWGTSNAQPVTLSFWVRSSLTGIFGGSIQNSSQGRSYPFSYTINSANTFEYKTVTIPGETTGTWLTDNNTGMSVWFSLGAGDSYVGTASTWVSNLLFSPTGATNLLSTNGATWYLTGVQLESGTVATPFERRSYGQELALCQRYYETCYQQGLAPGSGTSQNNILAVCPGNINRGYGHLQFQVKKRASATVTFYSTSGASGKFRNASQGTDITMSAACSFGDSGISYETSVGIVGVTDRLQGLYTAEAEL